METVKEKALRLADETLEMLKRELARWKKKKHVGLEMDTKAQIEAIKEFRSVLEDHL